MAGLDAGAEDYLAKPFDVDELLARLRALRGVTLAVVTGTEPPPVDAAPASLRRAVTALLDNAIRHADGAVRITTDRVGSRAIIDVTDDGPGLDPDIAKRLFTRFATTPADDRPGVRRRYGLGLALVSDIATRHGGSVSVLDAATPGATFRLSLPCRRAPENSQDGPAG